MQRIAAEVGYSEAAFIAPFHGKTRTVRYYSPQGEVMVRPSLLEVEIPSRSGIRRHGHGGGHTGEGVGSAAID